MNRGFRCHHPESCNCTADTAVKEIYLNWTAPKAGYREPGTVTVVRYFCSEHAGLAVAESERSHLVVNGNEQKNFSVQRRPLNEYLAEINPRLRTKERC